MVTRSGPLLLKRARAHKPACKRSGGDVPSHQAALDNRETCSDDWTKLCMQRTRCRVIPGTLPGRSHFFSCTPRIGLGQNKEKQTVGPEVGRRGLLDLRGRALLGIHLAYSESPFKELSALPDCMIPRMPARPCQASADSIALRSHVSKKDSNEVFS